MAIDPSHLLQLHGLPNFSLYPRGGDSMGLGRRWLFTSKLLRRILAGVDSWIASSSLSLKCCLAWLFTSKTRHRRPISPSPPQSQHGPPQRRSACPSSPPRPTSRRPFSPPPPSPSPSVPWPPKGQPTSPPPRVPAIPRPISTGELTEESISKRLNEAGVDEDSMKKRGKAALISYIAILESEIFGALNDMRAVNAEREVAYESKLAEACAMVESSQQKFEEAVSKLQKEESLHVEANQFKDTASRTLEDVIARHDDLRSWFEYECERKENEIETQRQSVFDAQKDLCQRQERLLEGETLLRQNEEYIFERSEKLNNFKKDMEIEKLKLEDEWRVFKKEKSDLEKDNVTLQKREEAVFKREVLLERREHEVLVLQEKLNKEYGEIQKQSEENHQTFEKKIKESETEVKPRCLFAEEEIIDKRIIKEVKVVDSVTGDGETMGKSLKDGSLCIEFEMLRKTIESLSYECEKFMAKFEPRSSNLFNKTKEEREEFARDLMVERIELENGMIRLSDDIETFRSEKQKPFKHLRGLENEKAEMALNCKRRERDCAMMQISSQSLDIEWQMLQMQWELMHGNWKEFYTKKLNLILRRL